MLDSPFAETSDVPGWVIIIDVQPGTPRERNREPP